MIKSLAESQLPFIEKLIKQSIAAAGNRDLARARTERTGGPRIKTLESLARKAKQKGWTFEAALTKAQDLSRRQKAHPIR